MPDLPINPLDADAADLLFKVLRRLDDLTTKHGVEFTGRVRLLGVSVPDPDKPAEETDEAGNVPTVVVTPVVTVAWSDAAGAHVALPAIEVTYG